MNTRPLLTARRVCKHDTFGKNGDCPCGLVNECRVPAPRPPRTYRHGPCIRCSAPVTVSESHNGALFCRECDRRMRWLSLALAAIVVLASVVIVGLRYFGAAVTP